MQTPTTFILVLMVSAIVALPSVLAIVRKHPHWLAITIFDILLGWTVIGWFAALAWVLRPVKIRQPRPSRAAKVREAKNARKGAAQPASPRLDTAANDNRSMSSVADVAPPALDDDIYGEWLERGSALSGSADVGDVISAPSVASVPKAAA